jgi:hypothetical protein
VVGKQAVKKIMINKQLKLYGLDCVFCDVVTASDRGIYNQM